jgi:membrane protease YdiL (CAAX protease family)
MFCPQCAAEYRPEFTRCNTCDVELVDRSFVSSSDSAVAHTDLIVPFFLITFALAWGYSVLAMRSSIPRIALVLLSVLGSFAPSLVALAGIVFQEGITGVRQLLGRFLVWRVGARWYLVALLYMPALVISVGLSSGLTTGVWLTPVESWGAMLTLAVLRTPVRASEEIGWRGFALPRLIQRFGFRKASLVLGLLWAAWHLHGFVSSSWPGDNISLPIFVIQVVALSVIFAWLYVCTNRSLLLVTLFHSAIDASPFVLPSPPRLQSVWDVPFDVATWLYVGLLWITAASCLKWISKASPECEPKI